jgi:hypothetical protein
MMTEVVLPGPVADALHAIRTATRDLVDATHGADPEAILAAMGRHGRSLDQFRRALESPEGQEMDPEDRGDLLEMVVNEAIAAESRLRELESWIRDELRSLGPATIGKGDYAGSSVDPSLAGRKR